MADRRVERLALAAGIATLAVAIGLVSLPQATAARAACDGRLPSIIAFELMREPADLGRVLGPAGACRDAGVAAMDATNRLDLALFIPAYAIFLAAAGFAVVRASGARWGWLPAALAVAAALADVVETRALLAITREGADLPALLATLAAGTWTKWLALAALGGVVLVAAVRSRPRRLALGASAVPVLVATPLAYPWPARLGEAMGLANGVLWLALLVAMIGAGRRPCGDVAR